MVTPIGGSGPLDPSAKIDQTPKPFSSEEKAAQEAVKIDPQKHPIAKWFMDNWRWEPEKALSAEKQFVKTVMHQCQSILNKYKNVYKKLNPDYME